MQSPTTALARSDRGWGRRPAGEATAPATPTRSDDDNYAASASPGETGSSEPRKTLSSPPMPAALRRSGA